MEVDGVRAAWEEGGRGSCCMWSVVWSRARQRELMGPAAVDDEAKSCLPAAFQAPQTAKHCYHPCHNSWVWLAQAWEEALEKQAGILFWQAASRSSSHSRLPAPKLQPFLCLPLPNPPLTLRSDPFCICSLLLSIASPESPLATLLQRSLLLPIRNSMLRT